MLNRLLRGSKPELGKAIVNTAANQQYDITEAYKTHNNIALPRAPANPYKKRPVKLKYDRNEYYTFRLPSEKHFLLSGFNTQEIFGEKEGINHSPHIKAQINLDDNLLWAWAIFMLLAMGFEMKYHDDYVNLRQNFVNSDYGKFELEDFK